jgi:hypothetical protein
MQRKAFDGIRETTARDLNELFCKTSGIAVAATRKLAKLGEAGRLRRTQPVSRAVGWKKRMKEFVFLWCLYVVEKNFNRKFGLVMLGL